MRKNSIIMDCGNKKVVHQQVSELRTSPYEKAKFRKENKKFTPIYPPATVSLHVAGSGAPGSPASLYVFAGQKSYLFNCGEGTQRLAHENKLKLTLLDNIFLTHKSWRNIGGLPGMLLTLQDTGCTDITLHGPPGIHVVYQETRSFMIFNDMTLSYNQYASNNGIVGTETDPMTIQAVPILLPNDQTNDLPHKMEFIVFTGSGLTSVDSADKEYGKRPKNDEASDCAERDTPTTKRSKTDANTTEMAMAYICKLSPKAGALSLEKCVKADVPPGPLLGQLKRGIDVTLPNGSVVRAADVKQPDCQGPVFLVVEAPTKEHLRPLVENELLGRHQTPNTEETAAVVVHFTPHCLVQDPLYQSWLAEFPSSTTHIFLNEASSCMGSMAVHRMQRKLNFLQPEIFPLLAESLPDVSLHNKLKEKKMNGEEGKTVLEATDCQNTANVYQAVTMLSHYLRPPSGISRSQCISIDGDTIEDEIKESGCQRQPALYPDLQEGEQSPSCTEYPRITFLGTGSCTPNKTRNVSCILVQLRSDKYMILDCGEGSYGQLVRLWGLTAASDVLANLVAVYVSHPHADHHLGLTGLLTNRGRVLEERGLQVTPLTLLAPSQIMPFLYAYDRAFSPITHLFRFIDNRNFIVNRTFIESSTMNPEVMLTPQQVVSLFEQLSLSHLAICTVYHCHQAYGVALTTDQGKKLVYSGDCRPSDKLIDIGLDCDVLIHEATLEDFLANEARLKKHCTVSEALDVSKKMRAKMVLLTHFSQRYSKLVMPLPDGAGDISRVAFAYDNMTISPSEIPRAAALYSHLQKMFAEYLENMKEKTAKKMRDRMRQGAIDEDLTQASN